MTECDRAKMRKLKERIARLERDSHPPVNLLPAVTAIVRNMLCQTRQMPFAHRDTRPTPLTDENQQSWDRAAEGGCSADFARTLERERDDVTHEAITARMDLARWIGCKECDTVLLFNHYDALRKELAELRETAEKQHVP